MAWVLLRSGLDVCVSSGGDPRTDHASSVRKGGDPKTDHASFGVVDQSEMAATCPPFRPGWLATTTANFDPLSTDCTESVVFVAACHERTDGFPSTVAACHERPDGFPSTAEDLDGLPSSADSKGREHPEGTNLDSTLDGKSTVFTRILHVAEESERLRQSDPGVQIVPASRSPSELSAHQMGLSLAGTSRLKIEPIVSTGILDIGETVGLTISDRALLRKFNSSEQVKEDSQHAASFKQENSTTVSRVDGHPPKQILSLYDRMLLRKYPDAGTKSTLSHSSSTVSSPPVAQLGESMKKRRRFHIKGNSSKANTGAVARNEKTPDHDGSLWIPIQGCRAICSFWTRRFTLDAGF